MSKFDFLKDLQLFVEQKAKSFLERNGCVDSFSEIKRKAETAKLNDGINHYFPRIEFTYNIHPASQWFRSNRIKIRRFEKHGL